MGKKLVLSIDQNCISWPISKSTVLSNFLTVRDHFTLDKFFVGLHPAQLWLCNLAGGRVRPIAYPPSHLFNFYWRICVLIRRWFSAGFGERRRRGRRLENDVVTARGEQQLVEQQPQRARRQSGRVAARRRRRRRRHQGGPLHDHARKRLDQRLWSEWLEISCTWPSQFLISALSCWNSSGTFAAIRSTK